MEVLPGSLLRDARHRAHLSQTELAHRAGVAQSVISAYESHHREPGLRTLSKLIEATGYELSLQLIPQHDETAIVPLKQRVTQQREAIIALAAHHGAHNIRLFGSAARGDDTSTSDIDLLVDLEENVGLLKLISLTQELTDLLGITVDVVPASMLKPQIRDKVLTEAVAL